MKKNNVVVLLPHYNDAEGLERSVSSISEEENVDLLIVDDGSTKSKINEENVRNNFKAQGEIIFLYLKENGGITVALNHGLDYIRQHGYEYIARLDSGDICLGNRFKIQSDFLQSHPNIHLIGSNITINDMSGNFLYKIVVPTNPKNFINRLFVTSSSVIHPTIMFKSEILKKVPYYPTKYYTEDYALYFEILKHKEYNIANINQFLLEKELNPNSMSLKNRKRQAGARLDVIKDNLYFGFFPLYGFLRNYILYLIPNSLLIKIKTVFLK